MCVSNVNGFSKLGLQMAITERLSFCYSTNLIDGNAKNLLARYNIQKDFESIHLYISKLKNPPTELKDISTWIRNSRFNLSDF